MNSSSSNQRSQKADKISGRSQHSHQDSNMQSEQHEHASSRPMRVAARRPENQEFKVAGEDFGGLRQKVQPGATKDAVADQKGFSLPLDKVVVQETPAGRKGEEPVNYLRQNLEHHVKVGLNKPSLTIFSSMGGGRNTSSTEIEFGGISDSNKGPNKEITPKEFEYRDEDFQPLTTAQGNLKQHGSYGPGSSRSGALASKNHPVQHKSQDADSTSYLGLTSSLFKKQSSGSHDHATPGVHAYHLAAFNEPVSHHAFATRAGHASVEASHHSQVPDISPELNLGTLLPEESSSEPATSKKALKKAQRASKASGHHVEPFNASDHSLHASKQQHPVSSTAQHVDIIGSAAHAQQHQQQYSHHQIQGHSHAVPPRDYYQADDESEEHTNHHQHQHHIVDHSSSVQKAQGVQAQGVHHQAEPFNTPMHLLHDPVKHSQQARHATAAPAHASAFPSTQLSKKQVSQKHQQQHPDRQQDHTPEMNLGSLFKEPEVSSASSRHAHAPGILHGQQSESAHRTASQVHPDPMHHAHAAPIYHAPSATASAPAHQSEIPVRHADHSALHQSAMPPVHHDAPAHHSAPEHHFPAEHISPAHRQAPVVAHPDPMHLAHAAPIYHAPSSTTAAAPVHHAPAGTSHYAPTHIETIHMPYHSSTTGASALAFGLGAAHGAASVIQSASAAKPDSSAAPTHQVPVYAHKPVLTLGKSHDEPVHQTPVIPMSQADAAGLNAASYPSFAHHAPEPALLPTHAPTQRVTSEVPRAQETHVKHGPSQAHVATGAPPKHAKKLSKRERKAAKKHDASKRQSVMESISSALVGRRKNSVSTPVMRLNELFDEPVNGNSTQELLGPSAAAASAAAVAGGIRSLLGSIHMPAMISRHPSEAHDVHLQDAPKMGAASAHGSTTAAHHIAKHVPSKAAALKSPKLDLTLFPEEQANYPRGEASKHENPARPASIVDVTEIHYQARREPQRHQHQHRGAIGAAAVPLAAAAPMILNLHQNQHQAQTHSAHGTWTTPTAQAPQHHSTAAALKTRKVPLGLFPEEEEDYPRGADFHHENRPAGPKGHPVAVTEIQLGAARGTSTASAAQAPEHHSTAATLRTRKVPVGLFPEEEEDYPRGADFHHENRPAGPKGHPIAVTEIQLGAARGTSTASAAQAPEHHSTAAALRTRKVPVGLFPEEEEDYPRGADFHHENRPAGPKGHPVAVTEIQLGAARGTSTASAAQAPEHHSTAAALRTRKVPLGLFPEEEEDYPRGADFHHENRPAGPKGHPVAVTEIQLGAARGTSTASAAQAPEHHSTAATLRAHKVPLGLFPEEEEDYPRGADFHHENRPVGPKGHPIAVQEIQLDAAHRHPHHDLHPTMAETATAVMEQGLEELSHSLEGASAAVEHGLEELGHGLEGVWTMLEGIHLPAMPAIPSLAAPAATVAVAATAARRSAAPATRTAPVHAPIHTGPTPSNTINTAKKPEVSALPLMYGTPVHHVSPSTAPAKPEYHAPSPVHATAPVHAAATTHHAAPAVVPVYIEPTVHVEHQSTKAASATSSSSRLQQQQTEGQKFAPSEHHSRSMDIHGLSDDEKYFSAEDVQSPAVASISNNLLNSRKYENVSILPPAKPSVHDSHAPAARNATAPVVAAALGSAAIPTAIHHRQAAAPVPIATPMAKVPIAQPPSERKAAPKIQTTQGSRGSQAPVQAYHTATHVALGSQAPIQTRQAAAPVASTHHSASSTIQAAVPLMGAAAAGVKDDELLMMESTTTTKNTPIYATARSVPATQQHVPVPVASDSARQEHVRAAVASTPATQQYVRTPIASAPATQQYAQASMTTGHSTQQQAHAPIASGFTKQHRAHAPVASVFASQQQQQPTRAPIASAPATHQNAPTSTGSAPATTIPVAPVMKKKTTTTTILPADVPLPIDDPALTYDSGARPVDTTVLPTLRGENIVIQATTTPKANADLSQHLGNVAAPVAAAVAAASVHASSASTQAPLATVPRPMLAMHEQDVHKPTPLQAPHPVIPLAQDIKTTSRAAETVANAPRPIIHHQQQHQQAKPVEIQVTTSSVKDQGAKPVAIEVKTSKPVTAEVPLKPIVAATAAAPIIATRHEAQHSNAQMQKTTVTTATTTVPIQAVKAVAVETHHAQQPALPAVRPAAVETHHHSQQPSVQMQKTSTTTTTAGPAPIPAARPVVAAAAAVPAAVAVASNLNKNTTASTTHYQQAPIQLQQPVQMQAMKTTAASTTVSQQQPILTQAATTRTSDTTIVERPAGYQGELPVVHSGESVIWVKKVYTTQEFFDSDDEDDQKLDEFGHRKDRDVSLHLPYSVTHSPPRRTSSGSLSSGNSQGIGNNAYIDATAPQQQGYGQSVDYSLQNQARPQQHQYAGNANLNQTSGRSGPAV